MDLQELRHDLHAHPRIAGDEEDTAERLAAFLREHGVHVQLGIGGHGLLARVGPAGPGPLLRCELDALPLREHTGLPYRAHEHHHACGHDGHMAMLAGALAQMPAEKTVYALFQPAEETGEGMQRCLPHIDVDVTQTFALHNIPGIPLGTVQVRRGSAAVASTGLRMQLTGRRSHASEPEKGANPIPLAAQIIAAIQASPREPGARAAMVEIHGGGPAYGTSAGDAMLGATLRAGSDAELERMVDSVLDAARHPEIRMEHTLIEPFPACPNADAAVSVVEAGARAAGLTCEAPEAPYPWSEDFGHALERWPGALFGLGAGDVLPLHDQAYDFPDALIDHGVRLWCAIAEAA